MAARGTRPRQVRSAVLGVVLASAALAGLTPAGPAARASAAPSAGAQATAGPGGFTALTPARILDTRTGLGAPLAKVASGRAIDVVVAGTGGIPTSGVAAVALNLTVTQPNGAGYVSAYPSGSARPATSTLNFAADQTLANAAVVKVGTGGAISLFESGASVHLVADVAGWYSSSPDVGDRFRPVPARRLLDTRSGSPVGPGEVRHVDLSGAVPSGTTAVALNVTAVQATTGGYLTVFPSGGARPVASNLNFSAGQVRANFVAVATGAGGVDVFNATGQTHVVVDLVGYWGPFGDGRFWPAEPTRLVDTRAGRGAAGPLGPDSTLDLDLASTFVLPTGRPAAVALNVTATQALPGGYVTVFNGDRPPTSNVNFGAGETVPNMVIAPLDAAGHVRIYNRSGYVQLIVDVQGWFDHGDGRLAYGRDSRMVNPDGGIQYSGNGIGTMSPDGGNVAVVASGRFYAPSWSPDGRFLLFSSDTAPIGSLVVAPSGGGTPVTLVASGHSGQFSPDGTRLAWSTNGGASPAIVVQKVTTSGDTVALVPGTAVTIPVLATGLAWSPDSKSISFVRGTDAGPQGPHDVWKVGADGRNLVQLTSQASLDVELSDRPKWSPDGTTLALIGRQGGLPFAWMLDADGSHLRRALPASSFDVSASWSPTGLLAVVTHYSNDIDVVDAQARLVAHVPLPELDAGRNAPGWSPDGRRLYYVGSPRPNAFGQPYNLYAISLDGSYHAQLSTDESVFTEPVSYP